MKNNRGFTLVELLAVIVLIAVLSVVAVSTYRGINESSKKKTLEAKIQQITTAAEKWARENNVTTKTTLSVNNLVVEGYITADSVGTDGLAVIKNPVTDENMICNVVNLTFKDGVIQSKFDGNVQNCKLAAQSLVDSKINIIVKSASGKDLTGPGNIARWTNEDVEIIVNSTEYDPKATSISYDFEGSTKTKDKDSLTKYTGTSYVTNPDDYYNVYYIKAELLLNTKIVVTYDIPGEGTKSRAYTIRFDNEEATAILKANNEWLTTNSTVQITLDDGKGSGPAAIYVSRDQGGYEESSRKTANPTVVLDELQVGKYYIWTVDNAGNISHTYKMILEINNQDKTTPACKVNFHGTEGDHGWYKKDAVTPGGETTLPAGISGVNVGVNDDPANPTYSAYAKYQDTIEGLGTTREEETPKNGWMYYCHAKSLAGNYNTDSARLYLDRTPPTLSVVVDNPQVHEQHKTAHVTIQDGLSGLNASTPLRYGLSQSATAGPGSWTDFNIDAAEQTNGAVTYDFVTSELVTGTWYLWIDASAFRDYAGNEPVTNTGSVSYVFGPYKFDNTPPTCDGNNGKTNWTNGAYTINEYCGDVYGTTDQSGCELPFFTKVYNNTQNVRSSDLTIRDNAGNTTVCPHDVYLEHIKPSCTLTEPGPDGTNGWYKSTSVTISASFQDNGDADVQSGIQYKGTATTENSTNGNTSITFTENSESLTAYCYVKDVAGNDNSNQLTIKKDDATYVQCEKYKENTTWVQNKAEPNGFRIAKPISGCETGYSSHTHGGHGQCYKDDNRVVKAGEAVTTRSFAADFITGSGVTVNCSGTFNIYVDKKVPTCSYNKTVTGTTSGVSATISCYDTDAGVSTCNGTSGSSSSVSGVTSNRSITVIDKVGNVGSCTIPITTSNCNCSNCHHTETVCHGGTVYGSWSDWGSCFPSGGPTVGTDTVQCVICNCQSSSGTCYKCRSRSSSWYSCATTTDECRYGCDTCYS